MSLPLLLNLIDEACKSGSITIDTKNYLLKKAVEFDISTEMVEKILSSKKIKIIEAEQPQNLTESVLSIINAPLRKIYSDYLSESKYDTIIDYFEDKLSGTLDYVLIDTYLKALLSKKEYQKAFTQSEILKENIKPDLKKIYPTLGQIYLNAKKYNKAFDIFYSLLEDDEPDSQQNIDLLVNKVLNDGEFDLIGKCRKNKNYLNIAKEKLPVYYEGKKYLFYIKLFEADFQDDNSFVKNYIWSLYRNVGTEINAYEKGKYYISKITNPESLSYVLGLTCSFLEKWIEAYDFFKNCLSRNIDVQENIDKIIDKLITKKEWITLEKFKTSINYETKIEQAFTSLNDVKDYVNLVSIFEVLFLDTNDKYKIKRYIRALQEIDFAECIKKYKEFSSKFTNNDKYWFWIGGKIYEQNDEFETALYLFEKADSMEVGYCADDVKRVNYIINPEIHFKDLYDDKKFPDAIRIFESKLKKSTDIDLIVPYISSLYRNQGTEEKGLELGILYSKSNSDGEKLFCTIAFICKYLKKYSQAKDYFTKAKMLGINVDEELQEVNMIIAKAEEAERKIKEEEEWKRKEDLERKRLEVQRRKEEAKERIQQEEEEEKRLEKQRKKEEKERIQQEIEEEEIKLKDDYQKQDEDFSKIGSHDFKSSITRGGDAIFPEHIHVDDNEVTWEKKTGVFSKDSKTIPMKNITQIDIETYLFGSKIKILGKGFGFIQGENFTNSDVKKIKSLIEKVQENL